MSIVYADHDYIDHQPSWMFHPQPDSVGWRLSVLSTAVDYLQLEMIMLDGHTTLTCQHCIRSASNHLLHMASPFWLLTPPPPPPSLWHMNLKVFFWMGKCLFLFFLDGMGVLARPGFFFLLCPCYLF
ncbi:hypothetical protein K504DRAFT_461368 [Pleomassaria siparia CBS 279.74]|uniref:Uncharacterized protein n=1 Tax=Pleomassaria siparia CBS 279.74 TaxID=1314801 RepID=A0A6G1JVT7_9PLEO|nr:hypothetical protein K504DRAFT_461368 [Pleomassaria siparia CBS 279.74]